jgi:uncharacterized membrane protein
MFRVLLLSALTSLASAATVTYNFNVGWVNVGQAIIWYMTQNFDLSSRLLQMATRGLSSASMASGRMLPCPLFYSKIP